MASAASGWITERELTSLEGLSPLCFQPAKKAPRECCAYLPGFRELLKRRVNRCFVGYCGIENGEKERVVLPVETIDKYAWGNRVKTGR